MKPKIMWFCAMHGRHEVTSLMIQCFKFNKEYWKHHLEMDMLVACSTNEDAKFLDDRGIYHIITKNNPVGRKMNTLAQHSLNFDYDYLMVTGSDDVYSPLLFDYYLTAIDEGHKYLGLNRVCILEPATRRAKMFNIPPVGKIGVAGPGRMIHKDIVSQLNGSIWPSTDNILDIPSNLRLSSIVKPHQLTVKYPLAFGIKTTENIWKFDEVKGNVEDYDYNDALDAIPKDYNPQNKQVA